VSVIVAIKDDDKVIMACDTRMSNDYGYEDSYNSRPKAIIVKKGILVGVSGCLGVLDIISTSLKDYLSENMSRIDIAFKFIPALREKLENTCLLDSDGYMESSILIAIRNKIYEICGNFDVSEKDEYGAIGIGKNCALGSFYTSKDVSVSQITRAYYAVKSAGNFMLGVSPEVFVASTKDNNFHRMDLGE